MNSTPIRPLTLEPLIWLPAGLHCVYRHGRRRDHASGTSRKSFTDGEDVTGSHPGGMSSSDLGLRVRLAWLKSP